MNIRKTNYVQVFQQPMFHWFYPDRSDYIEAFVNYLFN